MRSLLDVLGFEIRYQFKAPFFWGALLVFFLIHVFTITSIGIHLDENRRIDVNGAAKIIQVVSTLNYLAMLPVVVFVTTAITRDYDKSLASLFFVTPIGKLPFLMGRFIGAFSAALAVGLAGLLGTAIGTCRGLIRTFLAPTGLHHMSLVSSRSSCRISSSCARCYSRWLRSPDR